MRRLQADEGDGHVTQLAEAEGKVAEAPVGAQVGSDSDRKARKAWRKRTSKAVEGGVKSVSS